MSVWKIIVSLHRQTAINYMRNKPYNTEEESAPKVEELVSAYGRTAVSDNGMLASFQSCNAIVSKPGRMTVDEYFGEVKRVLHRKYEDLQG